MAGTKGTETVAPAGRIDVDTGALRGLEQALEGLDAERSVSVGGLWGSSQALAIAAWVERIDGPVVLVTSTAAEAESLALDLATFGARACLFPEREAAGNRRDEVDVDSVRRRLQVAARLAGKASERPRLVVTSVLSLLQPIPEPKDLAKGMLELATGGSLDVEHLLRRLVDAGYERQPLVEQPGEVSLRGDIFDVYPFAADLPVRIELFDEEIESLRRFDPAEQRSVERLDEVTLDLTADPGGVEDGHGIQPILLFPSETVFVEIEPLRVEDKAEGLRIRSGQHQRALGELERSFALHRRIDVQSLPGRDVTIETRSVQSLSEGIQEAPRLLREALERTPRIVVVCRNEAEAHRFGTVLEEAGGVPGVEMVVGRVAKGFRVPELGLTVINHRELVGVVGRERRIAPKVQHRTRALKSFFELKPGDFVVHAVHGLALYKGLELMTRGGGQEEHLHLLFADDVSLFVPVTRIDLVQRYIGSGSAAPSRDKIGGQSFRKRREKVERALFDLAAELLEVHAKRELKKREPWRPDAELVADLVGSFAWEDTKDQEQADEEISNDLASEQPMDRLLCGDVGFGKTEIAIRAAFRVASAGGQVAVLVPTTVLATQHLQTFRERLADFPITVEGMSRTAKGKAGKELVERVAKGEVDVLVGTHRILSKDVKFKNLGLVVIDEEQRFGVTHKEHFKALRAEVDILTLSATPIPRTLHMSLSGLRDISALAEPPPGRQEIETRLVDAREDAFLREALLAEKNRDGQVFFLHNRVDSIFATARRLQELVPECSFAVGHGQMGSRELMSVMKQFTQGDVDVLVATTIIENGLDIPSAGTILIDDADHFGLSELHQLRGRVGRGRSKAFCYLLVDRTKPIRQIARERLKALEEMNHLGAGFSISMKDLELRGAGNILGPQQSGHIASVGYDMYCRLLKETVERIKLGMGPEVLSSDRDMAKGVEMELGLVAFLPDTYVASQDERIDILRRFDGIHSDRDADEAIAGLRDRFGRLPDEAEALLASFRLRARLLPLGITRIALREEGYLIEFTDRVLIETAFAGTDAELRPLRTGLAMLVVPADRREPPSAFAWLMGILGGSPNEA